ncbi:MAG TPA: cytochrome c oxidase subunit 3 [Kofleriaceae bacterium]|nr:cytochrome c oxidase subunit 3 [Kofleriaceae bacterium]
MSTAHDAHADDHGHGHHGSPFIQHHYDDAQHQFDSGKFGIWIFLAQEVLFFSALFVAYILYRVHHGEIYSYAHKWLDVKYGAINTAVLIFSSLTAAWAVRAAQLNQKKLLVGCLATTIACACAFLCIKYIEYSHKYHEQILFGRYFDPCVSPNENPLITKSNDCAGKKTTIKWDYGAGKATEGCFEISALDLDPKEPGVQAECDVEEVHLAADGKTETSKKPITNICADKIGKGEEFEKNKYPCWKPSYQPAVCPDLTDGAKRAAGAAARPQVGILVDYGEGDHEHRGKDIAIKANCKKPAAPVAPDYFTEAQAQKPELGKALVAEHREEHTEHELLYAGPPPEHTNMFFTIYFAMTGLHGIHVLVGVFVFIWLLIRATKGHFTPDYFGPVDYAALYWHIVDLIWIFLFPLLYLIV